MSIIAAAVRHLMAAGVTGEALVQAIADMEAAHLAVPARDAAAEKRRAWDRERKRKAKMAGGIPVENAESGGTDGESPSLSRPLSPQPPLTPTHTHPDNNHTREWLVLFDAHVSAWEAWLAKASNRKLAMRDKPTDVTPQTWADFLAHRKRIKADATQTAVSRIRKQAEGAGWAMDDALAELVARGWRGFSSEWVKSSAKPGAVPVVSVDPLAQAEKTAALYRRMGRDEDAEAEEKRAARLRSGSGPPRSLGQIIGGLSAAP